MAGIMAKVITRFPPSPTGYFHIGRARTALFNYLYAKQQGGELVFRIEDTDKDRSKPEFEIDLIEGLKWLGIKWDNSEIAHQSTRTEIYKKYLSALVTAGKAYIGEGGKVVHFKNPNTTITFSDLIRGEISVDTTDLGDFIIARSIDDPLYHLTVVVDDFEMGITHVIRGDDGISNTPRQILLQEAIGAPRPIYAHIPLILAADRSKLSGRHGAVSVRDYKTKGYLPEALVNYLALLGWHPEGDQELFTVAELIDQFKLERVQKGGAIFDIEKLNWLNREHLKLLSDEEFANRAAEFWPEAPAGLLVKLAPEFKVRLTTLSEITTLASSGDLGFYSQAPAPTRELLKTTEFLPEIIAKLETITDMEFKVDVIKATLWDFATEKGRANVLWPMRVALTGLKQSPDPFFVASILGKAETLKRLKDAAAI